MKTKSTILNQNKTSEGPVESGNLYTYSSGSKLVIMSTGEEHDEISFPGVVVYSESSACPLGLFAETWNRNFVIPFIGKVCLETIENE